MKSKIFCLLSFEVVAELGAIVSCPTSADKLVTLLKHFTSQECKEALRIILESNVRGKYTLSQWSKGDKFQQARKPLQLQLYAT